MSLGRLLRSRRKVVYELTTQSVRIRMGDETREVLFEWIAAVEVVRVGGNLGHVLLWPEGVAHDPQAALERMQSAEQTSDPRAQPLILERIRDPEQAAESIRRAMQSLPLNETSVYR